jgi:hypothetical protein
MNFSDLRDTDPQLTVSLRLTLVGEPQGEIQIGSWRCALTDHVQHAVSMLEPLVIAVILRDKTYQENHEVAVVIDTIEIGSWHMTDAYNHLACYQNDRDGHPHARYLGFNGVWRLEIDQPFWLWHHDHTGQGMLIQPVKLESHQNS